MRRSMSPVTVPCCGMRFTLVRLLKAAEELADEVTTIEYRNHLRVAKKRMRAILYTRGMDKKARLYRDLIEVTEKSLAYVAQAILG